MARSTTQTGIESRRGPRLRRQSTGIPASTAFGAAEHQRNTSAEERGKDWSAAARTYPAPAAHAKERTAAWIPAARAGMPLERDRTVATRSPLRRFSGKNG